MASKQKPPVVVAELGRPETAAETSARKARDSQLYRQRKTVNNLVLSLIVSLGLVLVIVLAVPRGTGGWGEHSVDVGEAAAAASQSTGVALVVPEVPSTWKAKQAELRESGGGDITYWYVGYTTENGAYAAVLQAFTAAGTAVDATWISEQFERLDPTGQETLGGVDWNVYEYPERNPDETNVLFGAEGSLGATTALVFGTDSSSVLRTLTAAVGDAASRTQSGASTTQEVEQ
ncbi:DUF4245 family protein [Leucobacter sp. W1153]|uniref:DUF4245 family protein n=1 Tax=unclassified Leucobacter TaxID=2621730 RepID=UPI003F3C5CB9